jgi:hypothetical protein
MSFGFSKIYTKEHYQNNQVYCIYLLVRIITNIILFFSKVATMFYAF